LNGFANTRANMLRILSLLLVTLAPLLHAGAAAAEPSYPSRQLTIVVPYPAGANADTIARVLADKLTHSLKQTVVVENHAGGATVPATVQVLQAPADGHMLLVSGTNTNINPLLGIKVPYDAERDLVPVVLLVTFPALLVVHPSVPAASVAELVALAKSEPGVLTYGSPGPGNFAHLAMEQFKQRTGTDILHVPFRGLGPTMIGLLRNDVQMTVADIPGAIEHIAAGKLRALAQTGLSRMPQLPDLPTLAEAGVAGYEATGFLGIWTRAGTPAEALAVLNRDINQALTSSELKRYAAGKGMIIAGGTAESFASFLSHDRAIWSRVIAEGEIKAD
jgi:tripartite-type tricarboxylate transporter receptor subunit TctC